MDTLDGRKLSEDDLQLLRRLAHRLRKKNYTWEEVADILGLSLSVVIGWGRRFGVGGKDEDLHVSSGRRGARYGERRTLNLARETLLRDEILQHSPSKLGLPYAVWNRRAVQAAVKLLWDIDMPIRTVGEYLRRWGFTPQRPAKRALERNPVEVQRWLEIRYPAIRRRAMAQNAIILWEDETQVRQDAAWARSYSPRGYTPEQEHTARRPKFGLTMASALSNQGSMRFEFLDGTMSADAFIEFMKNLIRGAKQKIFLIVDRLPAHMAKKVREWVDANRDHIQLFYLPAYSPELNPDEWVNRDLKTELRTRPATNHTGTLKGMAYRFMTTLESSTKRVAGYFCNWHVAYAGSMPNIYSI